MLLAAATGALAIIQPCSVAAMQQLDAGEVPTRLQAGRHLLGPVPAPSPSPVVAPASPISPAPATAMSPTPTPTALPAQSPSMPTNGPTPGAPTPPAEAPASDPINSMAPAPAPPPELQDTYRIVTSTEQVENDGVLQFYWQDRGLNGFSWVNSTPEVIWEEGEVIFDQGGVICKGLSRRDDDLLGSQSATLHAAAEKGTCYAVGAAFSYMCDPGPDFNVSKVEDMFRDGEAYAFARTAVEAGLQCRSMNESLPNTCVSYTASATAIANATAEAHSAAVAAAVKNCSCMNDAVAKSFANDSLFVDLVADATVTSEATVCVEGLETDTDSMWSECTSVLYAKLFAKAAAKAAAYGDCLTLDAKVKIDSFVDAEVTVDNTPECDVEPMVKFRDGQGRPK